MSKPKTKRKPVIIKRINPLQCPLLLKHLCDVHTLIRRILYYSDECTNWPLTQQEQIAFMRFVMVEARKLRQSEGYMATELILAGQRAT